MQQMTALQQKYDSHNVDVREVSKGSFNHGFLGNTVEDVSVLKQFYGFASFPYGHYDKVLEMLSRHGFSITVLG